MDTFDWGNRIREWSRKKVELLSELERSQLPQRILESPYLGYPGATEEEIVSAESRLGVTLPPSYREFLKASNGLRYDLEGNDRNFSSTEDIEWYALGNEDFIEELEKIFSEPPVTDEQYFYYNEDQNLYMFRPEYLRTALEISEPYFGNVFFLNPQIVTPEGEWEAWFCSFHSAFGICRYRSFRKMMEIVLSEPEFI